MASQYITRQDTEFRYKGSRFRFIGFNCYPFVIDSMTQANVRAIFTNAHNRGVSVFRTWCFDRGKPPSNSSGNFRYLTTDSLGPDILANGTFESNTTGWGLDANFSRSNADSHSGTWSIAQNSTGGYQNFTTINDSIGIEVDPNTAYTLKFWYKLSVSGFGPIVNVNTGNAYGPTIGSANLSGTSGAWVQASVSFFSGANSNVWIRIYNNNGTVSGFYDDFTLNSGTGQTLAWVESTLVQLDMVLDEARKAGIKLVLSLADNTPNYDTKHTYVTWANAIYNAGLSNVYPYTAFFTSANCRTLYKDFIYGLVNRINTINGRLYKTDDTIFSWELGNELRYDVFDAEGGTQNTINSTNIAKVKNWIEDISTYIKSIDPNHMVGFSSLSHTWQWVQGDSVSNGSGYGIDYNLLSQITTLDYADFHCYPNQGGNELLKYGQRLGYPDAISGAGFRAQLRDYVAVCKANGKPVIMGEIGFTREVIGSNRYFPLYPRHEAFTAIMDEWFNADADGVLIWSATAVGFGSYSVGLGEVGTASYWGNNENSNDSILMQRINAKNTELVDTNKRARAV